MAIRGVRGAIVVEQDYSDLILAATREVLLAILQANPSMSPVDLACIIFSVTSDLHSVFPAKAVRQMGWENVPLMCCTEIQVTDSLPFCIRALLLWNTDLQQGEISPVYIGKAKILRPDLTL